MKTVEEARRRWEILSRHGKSTKDLRQAVIKEESGSPCEDGLRSVFWKAFLLCDNLDQSEWKLRLSDTRSAYESLKDHFLKYIHHPDDLESTVDPLAEDDESPWQALRRDEGIRAEIYQDVERCLQENYFFREPTTKAMMLDILFIYSKLNPDLGYRQGMHELLAPVLWVVERDAIDPKHLNTIDSRESDSLSQMLDSKYVEHDSFSLFCSIMQIARPFYEHADEKTVSGHTEIAPIVRLCQHIHDELLMNADYELASYLNSIEILPQIFLTRWIRLLYGREFSFEDTLLMWDVLFANGLRITLINNICVAMLLRVRWQLLQSDYSSALTLLLRYPPLQKHGPKTLVHDGLFLEQDSSPARGAFLISKYSNRSPDLTKQPLQHRLRGLSSKRNHARGDSVDEVKSQASSPGRSPARNSQRSLETLFQDVSEGLQRRTENWGVAKAVRGAVTEARRNMANVESGSVPSLRPWYSSPRFGTPVLGQSKDSNPVESAKQPTFLEKREENTELMQLLKHALDDLDVVKGATSTFEPRIAEALQGAYEKIQRARSKVQSPHQVTTAPVTDIDATSEQQKESEVVEEKDDSSLPRKTSAELPEEKQIPTEDSSTPTQESLISKEPEDPGTVKISETPSVAPLPLRPATSSSGVRPPLADSEFSWMLGEQTHRSTFVSSASLPPDQRRHSESRSKSPLFGDARDQARKGCTDEEDGLSLNSFT